MKLPRITTEKLPFVGPFSSIAQRRIRSLTQRFCKNLDIKWCLLPSYKIKNSFSVKDAIPKTVRSRVVYKFSCAGCNACYVGETNRHLATRGREHLTSDKNSHIFQPSTGLTLAKLCVQRQKQAVCVTKFDQSGCVI